MFWQIKCWSKFKSREKASTPEILGGTQVCFPLPLLLLFLLLLLLAVFITIIVNIVVSIIVIVIVVIMMFTFCRLLRACIILNLNEFSIHLFPKNMPGVMLALCNSWLLTVQKWLCLSLSYRRINWMTTLTIHTDVMLMQRKWSNNARGGDHDCVKQAVAAMLLD